MFLSFSAITMCSVCGKICPHWMDVHFFSYRCDFETSTASFRDRYPSPWTRAGNILDTVASAQKCFLLKPKEQKWIYYSFLAYTGNEHCCFANLTLFIPLNKTTHWLNLPLGQWLFYKRKHVTSLSPAFLCKWELKQNCFFKILHEIFLTI